MSNETLYPNGSAPRLVGENARETRSTGAPEGERATPVVAARGVAEFCTCKAADDMHIHAEDFGQLEPGALVRVPAETREELGALAARLISENANLRAELASVQRERDEAREDEDPAVVTTIDDCTITIQHEDIMVAHALMLRLRALTDGEAVAR